MQKSFLRETSGTIMRAVVVIVTIVLISISVNAVFEEESNISDGFCNIAVYPVEGIILPYHGIGDFEFVSTPDSLESFMDQVEEEDNIKGVLIEMNSPGGTPVASERMAERLRSSSLPVVGLIGDQGTSGGYMVAAATDYLIASAMSDIGSIGVNMSYVEESLKNEEEGITYVQLTTGKFKDAGNPNKAISEEEREMFQQDLDIVHEHFVDLVAEYRTMDRVLVAALADGSSMPGKRAFEEDLVDELGGRDEAETAFAKILKVEPDQISFCEYDSGFPLFY